MARNQEKAQSMLFRFRETQAIEMGIARPKDARRPRLASGCSNLKDCEKWRGEILREISRKVSKIQDAGMTDYAVRDLNDEINKLMREKSHWERQIVALGGANYRRARTGMIDEDGREVPGTRGYKYFGRAKDLPGVKELFNRGAIQESEESARAMSYQKFKNRGPDYYGDVDEMDAKLVGEEEEMEIEDWNTACAKLAELLDLPTSSVTPPFPKSTAASVLQSVPTDSHSKRKAPDADADADVEMSDGDAEKRKKVDGQEQVALTNDPAMAARISSFFRVLSPESIQPPKQPTKQEMEQILLDVRKKALLEEYGV